MKLLLIIFLSLFSCTKKTELKEEKSDTNIENNPEWIVVGNGKDEKNFIKSTSGKRFLVWGVNYDHDSTGTGRLLEDYWLDEWETVVEDFQEIKALGANVVRIHLQVAKFVNSPDAVNETSLKQLARLIRLAEQTGLYLNITGLGCYHKQDIPAWYDAMNETERWKTQAMFWKAVAKVCADSPAIFCYNLMNEPILAAKKENDGEKTENEWLGAGLGDKFFVQRITLDLAGRSKEEVAKAWIEKLTTVIRSQDKRHMITVGVIPWAHVWPKAKPLFYNKEVSASLDFVSVHFYPKAGEVDKALAALAVYDIGKPIVIEETFPLSCSPEELLDFIDRSRNIADGWISFYWGKSAQEYQETKGEKAMQSAIIADWLKKFQTKGKEIFR